MLIHRFENSTAIARVNYNPETKQMDVQFTSGGTYTHENVPPSVFEGLVGASSPGRYYAQNVKGVY
jgi:hypothetical protein